MKVPETVTEAWFEALSTQGRYSLYLEKKATTGWHCNTCEVDCDPVRHFASGSCLNKESTRRFYYKDNVVEMWPPLYREEKHSLLFIKKESALSLSREERHPLLCIEKEYASSI